jgi:hypothetical protein
VHELAVQHTSPRHAFGLHETLHEAPPQVTRPAHACVSQATSVVPVAALVTLPLHEPLAQ